MAGVFPVYGRFYGVMLLAFALFSLFMGYSYHEARDNSQRVAIAALYKVEEFATDAQGLPSIFQKVREDLLRYGCKPSLLRKAEPDTAMYNYFIIHVYGLRFSEFRTYMGIAYGALGLSMTPELELGLSRLSDYLRDLAQDCYTAMVTGKGFECDRLPSNEDIQVLVEAMEKIRHEVSLVIHEGKEFNGLGVESIRLLWDFIKRVEN